MEEVVLDDKSPMPFGVHKGVEMANVPASYLLWLYEGLKGTFLTVNTDQYRVFIYIKDNLDILESEVARGS